MQGTSGTFAFNGTALLLMPTDSRWVSREVLGIAGDGRPVYPLPREYEMTWELMDMASFAQIQGFYDAISYTGTVVVDLPKYATSPYTFFSYTGCTLKEPEVDKFYETHVTNVRLLILKVK